MQWKRSECGYYIHKHDYKISRARVQGNWRYSAWHRRELLGVCNSVDDAKMIIELHEAGLYPRGGITHESAAV